MGISVHAAETEMATTPYSTLYYVVQYRRCVAPVAGTGWGCTCYYGSAYYIEPT